MTRRPELDVARALAVVAVLIGHAGYAAGLHPIAARGVDVFFVLSGFLCATQLDAGVAPRPWLWRRLRRIYPAAWVVLLASGAPLAMLSLVTFGGPRDVNHLWSISVEVTGYAALGLMAWAVPRRWWVPVLAATALATALARFGADDGTAYRVLRWDGMALGALWALAGAPAIPLWAPLLVLAMFLPAQNAPAFAALGAVGLLSALRGSTIRLDWLCSRSYALYLVSVPLIEHLGFLGLVLAFPLAEMLYRLVDLPFGIGARHAR